MAFHDAAVTLPTQVGLPGAIPVGLPADSTVSAPATTSTLPSQSGARWKRRGLLGAAAAKRQDAAEMAAYLGYAAAWSAVRKLPERRAYQLFETFADRTWAKRGPSIIQLEKNLARVCPDADADQLAALSKESMRNYLRYWCDAFRMPDWTRERTVDTFRCENVELVDELLAEGRGLVIATTHMGNYDHTGAWAAATGRPLSSVAERLKPTRLFDRFVSYREELGIRVYPHGTPGVLDSLATELREQNRVVALISDRDMSSYGVPVTFFGHTAKFPPGPAKLALPTGAPLVTATLWYDGPTAVVHIAPQIALPPDAPTGEDCASQPGYTTAVAEITARIASELEVGIAAHPTHWHMLAKLWLDDLPARGSEG